MNRRHCLLLLLALLPATAPAQNPVLQLERRDAADGSPWRAGSTLAALAWSVVDGTPRSPRYRSMAEVPARTPDSDAPARQLSTHGFRFVGPTTCQALMQAAGLTNDHPATCPRHDTARRLSLIHTSEPTTP